MANNLAKGENTEELLREYFLEIGYFVVRSVKFRYKEFDITDIDLFLYSKSSPFSRQRTIVDIKRKKTPQAIERIFWTKGLQLTLGIENAIVATTDNRSDVTEFGNKNSVYVLDGDFIKRIDERNKRKEKNRLCEEEFTSILKTESIGDLYGDWRKKYEDLKSLLIKDLNFNTCNKYLNTIRELIEYYITSLGNELSIRMLYACTSFFLICLDYSLKDISFKEEDERIKDLSILFRYGQNGYQRTQEVIRYIEKVTVSTSTKDCVTKDVIRDTIEKEFKSIKAEILAEYFAKQNNASKLYEIAIRFESYAYNKKLIKVNELALEEASIIGVFCDFNNISRKKVI